MGKNIYGKTDTGRLRTNNEDTFLAEEIQEGRSLLAGVIDGVGGYEGGEVAAAIARESIRELITGPVTDVLRTMNEAIILANQRIIDAKQADPQKGSMACVLTLALADLSQNQFYYAHIGDTRLYLLRDHSLVKVTKDHSFVGFLEDSGRLSEDEAMRHPKRNEVNKALGFAHDVQLQVDYIETGVSPFLPGDLLLLCSDGLTDMVRSGDIIAILTGSGTLAQKGARLVDAANNAGGKDNITVVLVQHDQKRQPQAATRPAEEKKKEVKKEPLPPKPPPPKKSPSKNSRYIIIALAIACLALAGALAWLWYRQPSPVPAAHPVLPVRMARNAGELAFRSSILAGKGSLVLDSTRPARVILLTDSIRVDGDTFRLAGNGAVIRCDTANHGAAFMLPETARYVYLDNLVFEGFPVAILAAGHTLHLNNVRFVRCGVPVEYRYHLPDGKYISGRLNDSVFIRTDSLLIKKQVWP